jgi:hypothetical protein
MNSEVNAASGKSSACVRAEEVQEPLVYHM